MLGNSRGISGYPSTRGRCPKPYRASSPALVKEGDKVKLLGFDDRGKVRLSMKVVDQETGEDLEAKQKAEQPAEGAAE